MKIASFTFADDGDIPNHSNWPMIVYQGVLDSELDDAASAYEMMFARNGWGHGWRNGIFAFPHFHSNAHEVLGIAQGEAIVRFGGAEGRELRVSKGDAVLLPAGTGHQRLQASGDLLVIGAYPAGASSDLKRTGEPDKSLIRERIRKVPKPQNDPVAGPAGPMNSLWELHGSNGSS
jgi:uncharacterized protein YjlB